MKCVTNIVNNPKILTSEKLSDRFKFVWFKKFPYGFVISYLIGGWNFLPVCVLFSHEDEVLSLRKTASNMIDSCKNIQKDRNASTATHKKSKILL